MATIDIGSAAEDRANFLSLAITYIAKENPANVSGRITSVEIWAYLEMTGVKVATFEEVDTNIFTARDSYTVGTVTTGAKRTFEVDLDVQAGDYIGIYGTAGFIEANTSSGSGTWSKSGDHTECVEEAIDFTADRTMSLYGTGIFVKSLTGSFDFSGSLNKLPKIVLSGVLTATGSIVGIFVKSLSGVFGLTGILSSAKRFVKALSGILSFTSSLTVWIHYTWVGVSKAIGEWGAVSKVTDDCTKVSKEKGEFSKVEKE